MKTLRKYSVLLLSLLLLGVAGSAAQAMQILPISPPPVSHSETPEGIISVTPAEDEEDVAIDTQVLVQFSSSMLRCNFADVFTLELQGGSQVSGSGDYDDPTRTYIFTPDSDLVNQNWYDASFLMLGAGKCKANKKWSFKTADILDYVDPLDGAVNVAAETTIQSYYFFDTTSCTVTMDVFADGSPVSGTLTTYGGASNYSEFVPDADLPYAAVVSVDLSLVGAGTCNYNYSWSFEIEEDPYAVVLLYFIGTPLPGLDGVLLEWETATEFENLGFNLYRRYLENTPWEKLNDSLIPSKVPGGGLGAYYSWTDEDGIIPGETYWYLLEDVDFSGHKTQHGPIEVVVE